MMCYSYLYEQTWRRKYPLTKNACDRAGVSMSCKAHFSFHSPHKLLDTAHIYLGLTFKHVYVLGLFYVNTFYFIFIL